MAVKAETARREYMRAEQERVFKAAFPREEDRIAYLVERLRRTRTFAGK